MAAPPAWAVLGVPIDSAGRPGGTERAPAALRAAGLVAALGARDAGDVAVRIRGTRRDPRTGILASRDVLAVTPAVRRAVRGLLAGGERPLVLGGCCALLPGALAGARDVHRRNGLVSVDGHVDVYDGESSPTGEAADMPLGVALGRPPRAWVDAADGPSLEARDVIVLGARDPDEAADISGLLDGELADLTVYGPDALRRSGAQRAGLGAATRLADEPGRFWLALDVDVLDEDAMPATDYLMPGGLGWDELAELLAPLAASPALIGVSVACVNPEKDPDGALVQRTADLLGMLRER
ncbi:MAG TPA: arginase family protein [Solirubrobacteraceae bacterium]|nr:arginase family protein [Solirubrobacteraceae bacterium]